MALTFGFYNSSNHDRKYNATHLSSLFDGIINDGVFSSVEAALVVQESSGMIVNVGKGRAWFNRTWTNNDALLPLTIDAAHAILNRIDAVVLEVNAEESVRANTIKIVKGTAASVPVASTMVQTELVHQYPLAYIYIGAGAPAITQANITNKVGTVDCPFATGVMETITIDGFLAQWNAEFEDWFSNVQAQLEGNVATNLLNQINERIPLSQKGAANGVADLDANGKIIPLRVQKQRRGPSTNTTLLLSDAGHMVYTLGTDPTTITIPTNASVAFPLDTEIDIMQGNTGLATLVGASGVTLVAPTGALATISTGIFLGLLHLKKVATDTWVVTGMIPTRAQLGDLALLGSIHMFGNTITDPKYLLANGSAASRATYPDLFSNIGTKYGLNRTFTTTALTYQFSAEIIKFGNYYVSLTSSSTPTIIYSLDKVNWTGKIIYNANGLSTKLFVAGDKLCALMSYQGEYNGNVSMAYSTNVVDWTVSATKVVEGLAQGYTVSLYSLTYFKNNYYASYSVGSTSNGTPYYLNLCVRKSSSLDGPWIDFIVEPTEGVTVPSYKLYFTSNDNYMIRKGEYSSDGSNWISESSIDFDPTSYVVGSKTLKIKSDQYGYYFIFNGKLYTSADFIHWTTTPITGCLEAIRFSSTEFFIATLSTVYYKSASELCKVYPDISASTAIKAAMFIEGSLITLLSCSVNYVDQTIVTFSSTLDTFRLPDLSAIHPTTYIKALN